MRYSAIESGIDFVLALHFGESTSDGKELNYAKPRIEFTVSIYQHVRHPRHDSNLVIMCRTLT